MRMQLLSGVALLLTTMALGAQSTGIREVTATERSLITLNTRMRYTTMVILPDSEDIVDVICGDAGNWVISATHNILHVKPTKEAAATNLNIVGSSGTIYSFLLAEGKAPVADLNVYVTSEGRDASAKPKYYTAAQVDGTVAALEGEVKQAHAAVDAAQKIAERSVAEVKAQAPLTMQFPYESLPYKAPFLIRSMWVQGDMTYIRSDAPEMPVVYEMKDGQPALVNFQVPQPGVYVVPKVMASGYFMLGKERLAFASRKTSGD
jgi:conjugative transfer protein CagX